MSNKITSDGINTTIEYNGVREVISDGNYSAETSNVRKTHSNSGIQETGTQRNIDIRGNSQENCYTRGVTCEADIKIIGNPDQFDGKNYRKLQKALSELAGLVVQSGDDKKSLKLPPLPSLDFSKIVNNMTSEFSSKNPPPVPQIKSLSDVGIFMAEMTKWQTECYTSDIAERALRAAKLEAERQYMQYEENLISQANEMIDSVENLFSSGSQATEDREEKASYNIDRKTLFQTIPFEYITELEKKL